MAPTPVVVQPVYSLPVPQSLTPFVPAASRCRLMLHPWCNILKAKKKTGKEEGGKEGGGMGKREEEGEMGEREGEID